MAPPGKPAQPAPSYIPSGTPASDSGTAGDRSSQPYAQPDLRHFGTPLMSRGGFEGSGGRGLPRRGRRG